jgi:hypothetical protein
LIGQANNPTGNFGIYSASTYDSYFAGEVGFGTTTPTAPIHISKTQSVVSAAGMRITAGNDTAVAGQLYAIQAIVNCSHTTGTTTSVEGINFTAEYRGTSATSPAVTTMMGILARTGMDDTPGGGQVSGTITTGIALRAGSIINQATVGTPAVTYTNQIGVRIDNQGDTTVGGGSGLTITNAAGLVVALQTGAVTSNANVVIGQSTIPSGTWSIYNVSTRENYFAGPILIGGTTAAGGGTNYISFENGTAVTATAANTSALYAADTAAGDSNLFATNEQDYVTQLTGLDIAKTDDESVANNTPQNDDHLLVNLPATSRYYFKFYLFATSPATAGLLLQLDGTAGVSSLKANISIYDSTGALVAFGRKTAFNSSTGVDFTGDAYAVIEGTIEVSTAGTFRLEWAQNTTDAGNATVLQENSSLTLRRLNA